MEALEAVGKEGLLLVNDKEPGPSKREKPGGQT